MHLERDTQYLLHQFREGVANPDLNGVTLDDLADAERVSEINIQVYSPVLGEEDMGQDRDDQGGQRIRAELLRRSHRRFPRTLNLNLCGAHFSYISNLDSLTLSESVDSALTRHTICSATSLM